MGMSCRCLTGPSPCRVCPLRSVNRRVRLVRRGMSFGLRGSVLDRHSIEGTAPEIDMQERLTRRSRNFQPQTGPQGDEAYHGDGREDADDRIELKPHSGLSEPAPEPGHEKSIEQTAATLRRPNTRLSTAAFVVINQHQKNPDFQCFNPEQSTRFLCPVSDTQ